MRKNNRREWALVKIISYLLKKKNRKGGGFLGVQGQWTFGGIPKPVLGAEGVHLNLLRIFLILKKNRVSTHTSFLSFGR